MDSIRVQFIIDAIEKSAAEVGDPPEACPPEARKAVEFCVRVFDKLLPFIVEAVMEEVKKKKSL